MRDADKRRQPWRKAPGLLKIDDARTDAIADITGQGRLRGVSWHRAWRVGTMGGATQLSPGRSRAVRSIDGSAADDAMSQSTAAEKSGLW